jgi:three-Cys-motif partner protein
LLPGVTSGQSHEARRAVTGKLPRLEPDGLITPEVGPWGERKYRLVANYASMFSTSMKNKWECRVYIDLFAGSGRAKLEGSSHIVLGSPLLAVRLDTRFDEYVFCEEDGEKIEALRTRVARVAPDLKPVYVDEDANAAVDRVLAALPQPGRGYRVLCFCFVDPYKLRNLHFETLRKLAVRYMDFLVLIPSYMDAHRNRGLYVQEGNTAVDRFLGDPDWRRDWEKAERRRQDFGSFVADAFGRQMAEQGFLYKSLADMVHVRSTRENLPLYHLGFFSRNDLGRKFWRQARKYSKDQMDLFPED